MMFNSEPKMPPGEYDEKLIQRQSADLLPQAMDSDFALVRSVAMFPKIDPLPGAEPEAPLHYWNGKADGGEGRAHVRRHVVLAFRGVDKCGITIGDQPIQKHFKVAPHVRVRVFLNQQRGGSMQDLQGGQTGVEFSVRDPRLHLVGKLVEPATSRRNAHFM
jgi:hypothetical protein